jgi:hypothetical protein
MAKWRPALVKGRPRFKDPYMKALGNDSVLDRDGKTHATVDGNLFIYPGSGLELKPNEKGKIVLNCPRTIFFNCATGMRPC